MARRTALVASALALACGGATERAQDESDRANHAATPASPAVSGTNGSAAGPASEAVGGGPSQETTSGGAPIDEPAPIAEPPIVEAAPTSCLGEPGCPWSMRANMPDAMRGQGTVALDGRIYVIGGESVQDARRSSLARRPAPTTALPALYSTVYAYEPSSDSWSERARLPIGLYVLTAHTLAGKIYVFGGYGGQGFDNTVQVYDPMSDTWQLQPPMPAPHYAFTSEVVEGKVYVIGGHGPDPGDPTSIGWHHMSNVDIFDPAQGWSSGSPSPEPLAEAASCAIDGRVFVFGGVVGSTTSIYDAATDQWTLGTPPPVARAGHVCVRVGRHFYLIGGYTGDAMTESVDKYDPAADAWETLPSLPTTRLRLAAAAIDDEIFTFGGEGLVTTTYGDHGLSAAVEVLRVSPP